mmetsp:Transcript_21753/g.61882  ORF Transcript_21753/g.61882 Transcript_21753/m.61882 type:complete len:369 (-) Transcript_21753:513-1619(-)
MDLRRSGRSGARQAKSEEQDSKKIGVKREHDDSSGLHGHKRVRKHENAVKSEDEKALVQVEEGAGQDEMVAVSADEGSGEMVAAEPYPNLRRPSADECYAVERALRDLHGGDRVKGRDCSVLDMLVSVMLSQNTTDKLSKQTFQSLKAAFPTWRSVLDAPAADVEATIQKGGLAHTKVKRIQAILQSVVDEGHVVSGEPSLEHLRGVADEQVKPALLRYNGVGPKTVACVMMFGLGRSEFPVDTHVLHIAQRLHWVPQAATRIQAYQHLNRRVPDDIKHSLHLLLVEHGKCCVPCAKNGRLQKESSGSCPLQPLIHRGTTPPQLEGSTSQPAMLKDDDGPPASGAGAAAPAAVKTEGAELVRVKEEAE